MGVGIIYSNKENQENQVSQFEFPPPSYKTNDSESTLNIHKQNNNTYYFQQHNHRMNDFKQRNIVLPTMDYATIQRGKFKGLIDSRRFRCKYHSINPNSCICDVIPLVSSPLRNTRAIRTGSSSSILKQPKQPSYYHNSNQHRWKYHRNQYSKVPYLQSSSSYLRSETHPTSVTESVIGPPFYEEVITNPPSGLTTTTTITTEDEFAFGPILHDGSLTTTRAMISLSLPSTSSSSSSTSSSSGSTSSNASISLSYFTKNGECRKFVPSIRVEKVEPVEQKRQQRGAEGEEREEAESTVANEPGLLIPNTRSPEISLQSGGGSPTLSQTFPVSSNDCLKFVPGPDYMYNRKLRILLNKDDDSIEYNHTQSSCLNLENTTTDKDEQSKNRCAS